MKKPAKFKMIFATAIMTVMSINTAVFAAEPQLVMFCSGWNVKCREARKVFLNTSNDLNLKFSEFDMDDPSTPQNAGQMGLDIPSNIPYYYLLSPKGGVLLQGVYKGESTPVFKQKLQTRLK